MQLSFRLNDEDAKLVKFFMVNDVRCERLNEALKFIMEDAAKKIEGKDSDWNWLTIKGQMMPNVGPIVLEKDDKGAKTFIIEDSSYETITKSFEEAFGVTRIRISYLVRLCIKAAIIDMSENKGIELKGLPITVEIENIDGVLLINKLTELLLNKDDREVREKLIMIRELLQ